ncbi:MAG: polysaccharide deacetylase family protein [Oscillospiraceae bacterium]|nr:polysaccharide deacetylase family protein [Oscillospiraceae bacterium]
MYFGSVKFFKHLIVAVLAIFMAASVALIALLTIENNDLRRRLDDYTSGGQSISSGDNVSEGSESGDTSNTIDDSDNTTVSLPDEDNTSLEMSVWPPEPFGEFGELFTELYATVPPWEVELIEYSANNIYLTFDDGPNHMTNTILNHLRDNDVSATFFVIPRDTTQTIMRRIHDEGHAIGVHSYSHVLHEIYESVEAFLEDFNQARTLIYEQTGMMSDIFRFPGGSVNSYNSDVREDIITEMERRGFVYFDWNVDSDDVGGASYDRMLRDIPQYINTNFEEGERSIVLFHDAAPFTTWVLGDLLSVLQRSPNGYSFETLCINTVPHQW